MCRWRRALYILVLLTGKTEDARIQSQKPENLTAQGQLLQALYIYPVHIFYI